jgi:Choline/ethanolamine kinase
MLCGRLLGNAELRVQSLYSFEPASAYPSDWVVVPLWGRSSKHRNSTTLRCALNRLILCRLDQARSVQFEDERKAAVHKTLDFDAMSQEISKVREKCDKTGSPVVFCHNDLLSGNIMVMGGFQNDRIEDMACKLLQFIDFEYGCYSYRGFDWGVLHSSVLRELRRL